MGGDPDHSDAEAPHADETYHKGEVYVTGTAADAAGHNGEAEENLCSSCDAECDVAKIDHLWVICKQVDDGAGQDVYRYAGCQNDSCTCLLYTSTGKCYRRYGRQLLEQE